VPFRVFRSAARTAAFQRRLVLSGRLPVQRFAHSSIAVYGFGDPTLPLAIPSAVWSSSGRLRRPQLSNLATPLLGLGPPGSITQQTLANPPKRISPSLGLCFPTAHEGSEVHLPRALPARYVPPSGFGYPPDGFLPAIPRRLCFAPAALLGFTLRSFLLPKGIPAVSDRKNPLTVSPTGIPVARAAGRHGRPRFLGFAPFEESLAANVCLARQPLDAPLGFTLRGLQATSLDRAFTKPPLTRFTDRVLTPPSAPQSIDQLAPCLTCLAANRATRRDNPLRVLAPARS
jgi:hypothetical protein